MKRLSISRNIACLMMVNILGLTLTGCGASDNISGDELYAAWDAGSEYIRESEEVTYKEEGQEPSYNTEYSLSVPTYIGKIDDNWFIVDCYHDQIIYNDNLDDSLSSWKVLTKDVHYPHTMASDGKVILVDDTENNRVLVFEKTETGYQNTQVINEIGQRPHYTVYDEEDKAFYVWSSTTGELYVFRRHEDDTKIYLTEIRSIEELSGTYIRSFYLDGDDIYFVSGITPSGTSSGIIKCDKRTLKVKEKYAVPDSIAGMAAMGYENGYYFITVSTDVTGNQDAATMIKAKSLEALEKEDYTEIYSDYFVGGGTPYNFYKVDGSFYLTEHRLPSHAIWRYKIDENGDIKDVESVY